MPRGVTPVSQLRRLRADLKLEREARGHTQAAVAEALEWSLSKLIRIEKGPVGISITDLKALLHHYKITDDDRVNELLKMARDSKGEAWWHKYRDGSSPQFLKFLGLESSAIRIRQCHVLVVPGLLQTPEYAHALVAASSSDPEVIEKGVAVRMERQQALVPGGPEFFFILDESVLYRMVGSPKIMRGQLLRLKELAALPNVSVQILSFAGGKHPGMGSSFEIFEMSTQEDDYALLLERPYRDVLIEESSEETLEYVKLFFGLEKIALSKDDSIKLIDQTLERMGENP